MPDKRGRRQGDRLGPYELQQLLGRGGMGEVWEAVLHGPGGFRKPVALKCLHAGALASTAARDTLLREARLGASLHHPNVVGTLAVSNEDGSWVIALELVRGLTLSELIRYGPLPPRALIDAGTQIARGLFHAHAAGLVHRDIKASNLLIDQTGLVKIADLGISVGAGDAAGGAAGTLGYSAPEQLQGRAEPRSDLFSLGVTLFLLATGRRPFGTGWRAAARIRGARPLMTDALREDADEAVAGLSGVLERCLCADPEQRWRDARELAVALGRLLSGQTEPGASLLQVLAGLRPDLQSDFAATPESEASTRVLPRGNLPVRRDRFVGRTHELAQVHSHVIDADDRWVVVLGPGGMGKTRLALEVARSVRMQLGGGAWAFDLSEARSESEVCAAVARVLGLDLRGADDVTQVGLALAERGPALMVMDNLEQCVDSLPNTVGRWLDLAPAARFLATSRVRPQLRGEVVVGLGALREEDAIDLFQERSPRPPEPTDRPHVRAICAAVEGMPLAIELAAARVGLLTVRGVRERLGLSVLSGGGRDRPARHRSLHASLEWSASLLSPAAFAALATVSVFEGGFTLAAADAVVRLPSAVDLLAILEELVDASLLRVDQHTGRFSMLMVVRAFASDLLVDPERQEVQVLHGRHFAQLGTVEAVDRLDLAGGTARRHVLACELDNLMAACRSAVDREDGVVAVATLRAAAAVLRLQGPLQLAAQLAGRVCALSLGPDDEAWARLLAGRALRNLGATAEAEASLRIALEIAQQLDEPQVEAHVNKQLGALAYNRGHMEEAFRALENARATYRRAGATHLEAQLLGNLGTVHLERGHYVAAESTLRQAIQMHRAVGDRRSEGISLAALALMLRNVGRNEESHATCLEALAAHRDVGNPISEAIVYGYLGGLRMQAGQLEEARAHFQAALALQRRLGDRRFEAVSQSHLATLSIELGELASAQRHAETSLALHQQIGAQRNEAVVHGLLGDIAADRGRLEQAKQSYDAAVETLEPLGYPAYLGHFMGRQARLRALLGDPVEAMTRLERAAVLVRQGGSDPYLESQVLAIRGEILWCAGQAEPARAALAEAERLCPEGMNDARRQLRRTRATLNAN